MGLVHWRLKCTGPLVLWATGFQNFFPALLAKLFLNFNLYFLIQTVINLTTKIISTFYSQRQSPSCIQFGDCTSCNVKHWLVVYLSIWFYFLLTPAISLISHMLPRSDCSQRWGKMILNRSFEHSHPSTYNKCGYAQLVSNAWIVTFWQDRSVQKLSFPSTCDVMWFWCSWCHVIL